MMQFFKQKINLYQKTQAYLPTLSAMRIMQIWLALLALLIISAFIHKLILINHVKEIETLKEEQSQENSELLELSQNKKVNNVVKAKNEMILLKEKIADIDSIVSQLKQLEDEDRSPFSFYVESIAMRHVKGTYLAYINLQDEGRRMSFSGVALEPQLVPIMVQSWQKSPSIISTQVKKVRLDNLKQDKDYVKFNLQAE
ncbi:hypothetical protein [Candidatus Berkiella aquae]|uniref:Fimbrial assembly protein (PilN) n=2 Tax=Candidatus Berkiella aquae TaxID=295108 RepID=A0AAE3HYN9_9GAMM|nr:hypothetical protein [Candidatus Berkiella aquae]MCS5712673.1 hypothetical protein [Candidatus Berkiella aquae]